MNLLDFIQEHKSAAAAAGMAAVHFAHLAWPRLVAIFPYCRENGGAFGIAKQFLLGRAGSVPDPNLMFPGPAAIPPAPPANPKPN